MEFTDEEECTVDDTWSWEFECPSFVDFTKLSEYDGLTDDKWFTYHHANHEPIQPISEEPRSLLSPTSEKISSDVDHSEYEKKTRIKQEKPLIQGGLKNGAKIKEKLLSKGPQSGKDATLEVIQSKLNIKPTQKNNLNKPKANSITIRAQDLNSDNSEIIDVDFLDEELKQMLSEHNRKFESSIKKSTSDLEEHKENFKNLVEDNSSTLLKNKRVPVTCHNPKVTSNYKPASNKKLSIDIEDDIKAMLSQHNKKFKQTVYEPRKYSHKDIKMWETFSGKRWVECTMPEREEANEWIAQQKKLQET